jgi:tetratricopeptide (TPR) repeat protein
LNSGESHEDAVGWAGELAHLFRRLMSTSGAVPGTGKPPSLRQIAKRSGYVPSHVRDVLNGVGRPSVDAVVAVAGALNAPEQDLWLAAFYAEQLGRSPRRKSTKTNVTADPDAPGTGHGLSVSDDGGKGYRPKQVNTAPTMLLGRNAEIRQLHESIHETIRGGGRVVLIEGEPGIGKSSLLRAATRPAAAAGCQVFWASCDELSTAFPLLPLLDALDGRERADGTRFDTAHLLRSDTTTKDRIDPVATAVERLLALVEELCAIAPVMLVVDDLQWADPATVMTVGRMIKSAPRLPLLVAAATRPVPRRDDLGALRHIVEPHDLLALRELAEADVTDLVARTAGGPPGPRLLQLARGAGGNPLYLTELIDALVRGLALTNDNGKVDAAVASVPQSLSAAIADRLRFVSPSAREVLHVAALLGTEFSISELAVVSRKRVNDLLPVLHEATLAGVLLDNGHELAFRHPLIRSALYDGMSPAVRPAWHCDAAQALAEAGAAANRVARQLVPAVDGHDLAAPWIVQWLTHTGHQLVGRAPHAAIKLLRWTLTATPADIAPHEVLTCRLADALYRVGDLAGAADVATSALAHTTRPDILVDLHWTLAQCQALDGRPEEALAALARALDDPDLGPTERARLLVLTARTRRSLGQVDTAGQLAEQALAAATVAADPWATGWALAVLAIVHCVRGKPAEALPLFERALLAAAGDPTLADLSLMLQFNHAVALGDLDRIGQAINAAKQARQLAGDTGNVVRLTQAQSVLSKLLFDAGRWDEALAEIACACQASRNPVVECCNQGIAATIKLHRGDPVGSQHLDDARPYAARLTGHTIAPLALARSLDRERANEPAEALAILTHELSSEGTDETLELLADAVRLAVMAGDQEVAHAAIRQAQSAASISNVSHTQAVAWHCRGLLEQDPVALITAVSHYQKAGRLLPQAQALEAAGHASAYVGDTATASTHLTRAVALYTKLGADWDIARTRTTFHAVPDPLE